jgi:hypothetical protein
MAVLRRLTALVTLVATLLLVLTESGFACPGDAMASMAGMDATAPSMAGMPGMGGTPSTPSATRTGDGGAPEQSPCRLPWAPDGCRDMAPCAPAALAVATAAPTASASVPEARTDRRVTAPASVDTPPDSPPPRA